MQHHQRIRGIKRKNAGQVETQTILFPLPPGKKKRPKRDKKNDNTTESNVNINVGRANNNMRL